MNAISTNTSRHLRHLLLAAFIASFSSLIIPAMAGPGAHGPNGEHLDAPVAAMSPGNTDPHLETKSEMFELVAKLEGGLLSIMIDRFETNEPVLGASVEVESGTAKAKATYRAEQGDYAVNDPALVSLLAGKGNHSLVFTISAGKDSDLLDGVLISGNTASSDPASGHSNDRWLMPIAWTGAALLGLGAISFFVWRRRAARLYTIKSARGVQ